MQITNTMIPTVATASPAAPAVNGEMMPQGSGFMSLITQLLSACGDLAIDMSAVDALKSRLEEEGQELSAQMLAQLMANPLLSSVLTQQPQEANLTAGVANSTQPLWQQSSLTTAEVAAPMTESVKGEVLSHTVGQQEPQTELDQSLLAQSRFHSLLKDAKSSTQTASQLQGLEALDIDRLQEEIKAGKFNLMQHGAATGIQTSTVEAGAEPVPEASLLNQVTEGIAENLTSGKNEFVVKLKPEGLGEITVKMAEIGSKISLTITTSSEQTSRMLSAELGALKEALRPYNAEVQEVVSSASQASNYLFSEGDQGSFARQQAFNREQSRGNHHRGASDLVTEAVSMPIVQQNGALDVHI